jgi:hypothetical protein
MALTWKQAIWMYIVLKLLGTSYRLFTPFYLQQLQVNDKMQHIGYLATRFKLHSLYRVEC